MRVERVACLRCRPGDWTRSPPPPPAQLEAGAASQRTSRTAELLHWHEAAARGAGGPRYWWHDVTWHRQWERPQIDGRSPDEAREEVMRTVRAAGDDGAEGVAAPLAQPLQG